MSSDNNDTSNVVGGEASADYMILGSGEQPEDKGKKSDVGTITDKIKDKVAGAGRSVKEGISGATGKDDSDYATDELESAQTRQAKIGDASSDPRSTGPTENLREKAARTTNEDEDSEEPA